jgi:hypothetical protein
MMNLRLQCIHDFDHQCKPFLADGIRRLVSLYTVYAEKRGDYVQKRYTLHMTQVVVQELINSLDSAS